MAVNSNAPDSEKVVDVHCHVGLLGDQYPELGKMSESYTQQLVYHVFLLFVGLDKDDVSDRTLREATERTICESKVDHVVCLALDPVYDPGGVKREHLSDMWVSNEYILELQQSIGDKVLFGASVHPYDPRFEARVDECVEKGAVLLKWLPSAQQFDLADSRVRDALTYLATARDGAPLPLLLHCGVEYAIESTDRRTSSYDYLTWTWWDRVRNTLRFSQRWHRPDTKTIEENLKAGLGEGAVIIFAHCGLPYYAPNRLRQVLEHSEFKTVSRYLHEFPADAPEGGRCYADVSACVTPFRRTYFKDIGKLPPQSLLYGSDFPTPVFELSADLEEVWEDFKAVLEGHWERIVVPEDNLLDVNLEELKHFFEGHPMFTNFSALL